MGVYSEYLDRNLGFAELTQERKTQLSKISAKRGNRDILVYAADLNKPHAPISIDYSDLLPINDQLANLSGTELDLIIETPGGSGEIAEDIVRLIREKYQHVAVIVPGCAKSAGTILAMAADEILMEPASSLGPIDAQLNWQGKVFSADALLEGFNKIKKAVEETGVLNKAYIPILQGMSPGELQNAENALMFAEDLVTRWLATYKFKNWETHASDGRPVVDQDRQDRAKKVAKELRNHGRWFTHGRSLKIQDLRSLKLEIVDYLTKASLADPIRRYHTLLQMSFSTNIYKIIETPTSQIYRFINAGEAVISQSDIAVFDALCGRCKATMRVQANLGKKSPLQQGCLPFPQSNKLACQKCGNEIDLTQARRQIEAQAKKPLVF